MHFLTYVLIPKSEKSPEELVKEIMEPFKENFEEELEENGHWDWYRIGGCWNNYYFTIGFNISGISGNIISTKQLLEALSTEVYRDITPAAIVSENGWFDNRLSKSMSDEDWRVMVIKELEKIDGFAVIVDCHS